MSKLIVSLFQMPKKSKNAGFLQVFLKQRNDLLQPGLEPGYNQMVTTKLALIREVRGGQESVSQYSARFLPWIDIFSSPDWTPPLW